MDEETVEVPKARVDKKQLFQAMRRAKSDFMNAAATESWEEARKARKNYTTLVGIADEVGITSQWRQADIILSESRGGPGRSAYAEVLPENLNKQMLERGLKVDIIDNKFNTPFFRSLGVPSHLAEAAAAYHRPDTDPDSEIYAQGMVVNDFVNKGKNAFEMDRLVDATKANAAKLAAADDMELTPRDRYGLAAQAAEAGMDPTSFNYLLSVSKNIVAPKDKANVSASDRKQTFIATASSLAGAVKKMQDPGAGVAALKYLSETPGLVKTEGMAPASLVKAVTIVSGIRAKAGALPAGDSIVDDTIKLRLHNEGISKLDPKEAAELGFKMDKMAAESATSAEFAAAVAAGDMDEAAALLSGMSKESDVYKEFVGGLNPESRSVVDSFMTQAQALSQADVAMEARGGRGAMAIQSVLAPSATVDTFGAYAEMLLNGSAGVSVTDPDERKFFQSVADSFGPTRAGESKLKDVEGLFAKGVIDKGTGEKDNATETLKDLYSQVRYSFRDKLSAARTSYGSSRAMALTPAGSSIFNASEARRTGIFSGKNKLTSEKFDEQLKKEVVYRGDSGQTLTMAQLISEDAWGRSTLYEYMKNGAPGNNYAERTAAYENLVQQLVKRQIARGALRGSSDGTDIVYNTEKASPLTDTPTTDPVGKTLTTTMFKGEVIDLATPEGRLKAIERTHRAEDLARMGASTNDLNMYKKAKEELENYRKLEEDLKATRNLMSNKDIIKASTRSSLRPIQDMERLKAIEELATEAGRYNAANTARRGLMIITPPEPVPEPKAKK